MPSRIAQALRRLIDPELRWALGFVRPYRRPLVLIGALSLVGTFVALALPYLAKILVDAALVGGDLRALYLIVGVFAALTLLNFGLNVFSGIRYARVSADVLFDMRAAVYRHLQRLSPTYYARTPLGEIVSRINNDVGEVQRVLSEAALGWFGNLVFLVGAIALMLVLDVRLFLIGVALVPLSVWLLVRFRRRFEASQAELRARSAEVGSFLIETLQAVRLVVGSNAQEREVGRFARHNDAFVGAMLRMQRLRYMSGGLPTLILSASTALIFVYGGSRVIAGTLTLGTFVAFMAYQARLLGPIQGMMGLYTSLATVRVALRRVHQLLEVPPAVADPALPRLLPARPTGELALRDVSFGFGRGGAVLERVDVRIAPGERVAIIGASGSGKSTLADLLVRHLDPERGSILLDGVDLRALRLADVRSWIVAVDQEPYLFHASLADNVRYAAPDATDSQVMDALAGAGLRELMERLPDGVETIVGERGRALSVGERQRVALARALLTDPAVIVLDEPTAALDPEAETAAREGYERAFAGRTLIVITHRLDLAQHADRVIALRDGKLAQDGPPELLIPQPLAAAPL